MLRLTRARYQDAPREFQAAIDSGWEHHRPWGNLGDAYLQLDRYDEAKAAYLRAAELSKAHIEVNPADAESRAELSMYLAGLELCRESRQEAASTLELDPENPTLRFYLAVAFVRCGDRTEAVTHLARAIEGGVVSDAQSNPELQSLLETPPIQKLLR